jgi:5-methylcytosine-specific restriction endonuclease McrA
MRSKFKLPYPSLCVLRASVAILFPTVGLNMTTKKLNAEQVWKDFEDHLAPRLGLSSIDRVVYSHLVRHTRLEGELQLRFSIPWLARSTGLSHNPVRWTVRRLVAHGVLRLLERSRAGHLVEVRLPSEVRAARPKRLSRRPLCRTRAFDFDDLDFLKDPALRRSIHARERGRCFYCLTRLTPATRCLDHVVPLAEFGDNSCRNLVSCCQKCNSKKSDLPAADLLRRLHRERLLTTGELGARLRALNKLASGHLRPRIDLQPIRDRRRRPGHASGSA